MRPVAEYRVLEVVKVLHVHVGASQRPRARREIDLDVATVDDRSPEQAVLADAWIEISDLCAPRTGRVEDVNSDEAEGRIPHVAIMAAEHSLHEPHVVEEEWQRLPLPRLPIPPLTRTTDERERAGTVEVVHGGRLRVWSEQDGRSENVLIARLGKNSTEVGIGSASPKPGLPAKARSGRSNAVPAAAPIAAAPAAVRRDSRRDDP